jgi:hypothetical protein
MTTENRFANVIDAIDELVNESLLRGPNDDFSQPLGRTTERGTRTRDLCEYCGRTWHGLPRDDCEGAWVDNSSEADLAAEVYPYYTVEIQIEVASNAAPSSREAALLAVRAILTGDVTATVTTPREDIEEVDLTDC